MSARLFVTPEYARRLDWAWVRLMLAFGIGVTVQDMPPKYPALWLESPSHER